MTITQVKQDTMAALPIRDKLAKGNRVLTDYDMRVLEHAFMDWQEFFATM